jgi:hypothetical protein
VPSGVTRWPIPRSGAVVAGLRLMKAGSGVVLTDIAPATAAAPARTIAVQASAAVIKGLFMTRSVGRRRRDRHSDLGATTGRRTIVHWLLEPRRVFREASGIAANPTPGRTERGTMSKYPNRFAVIAVMSAIALGMLTAVPAYAKNAKTQKHGTCSKGSHWKLAVSHDAGRIETEFEVDSNRVGRKWNVVITDNGVRVFSGARITKAPSGSFTVAPRPADRAGLDHIVATAKAVKSGETCTGRASI